MADTILVGTRKGLFTLQRRSGGWHVADVTFLGDPVPMVLHDDRDGARYAALDLGHFGSKLQRLQPGGEWTEIAVPSYPEKPEGLDDESPDSRQPVPWNLKLIWALVGAGSDREGALWCGTLPGGLFSSDDRGDNWSLVESLWNHEGRQEWFGGGAELPGIHSICVDPRDSRRVTVGVSCGGVWVSEDEGGSWTCRADGMRANYMPPERSNDPGIQDPHQIVQCAAAPDVFWAQHHNGIWKSTDNCGLWTEIERAGPSTFGFGVAVHPRDPDTAWFVPGVKDDARYPPDANLVVTRTRDGGKSFDVLREGLPQGHAYDLVFRHALHIDSSGETLAFGSTTGSLWVSDDGGDSWASVSTHLPPVYVVRVVG